MEYLTMINKFLEKISFGPEHGDWSSALVTLLFGCAAFFGFMYRSVKSLNEAKEQRKEQERLRISEENESYMKYRQRFADLWLELTKNGKAHLFKNYKNKSSLLEVLNNDINEVNRVKTLTYQIILLLSDIEFIYCRKQQTSYWKKWNSTFEHVFNKQLFKTSFLKHRKDFETSNMSFIEYVEGVFDRQVKDVSTNNKEENLNSLII
jgi:hypothetical protein